METIDILRNSFGQYRLATKDHSVDPVLKMLKDMVEPEPLLRVLEAIRHLSHENVGYIGGNVLTILGETQPCLRGVLLSDTVLAEAKIERVDLSDANLEGSVLRDSQFTHVVLRGVNLRDADLRGFRAREQIGTWRPIAFSPTGQSLLTGGFGYEGQVWDVRGRRLSLLTKLPHDDFVTTTAWSPDGALVATGGRDQVTVWRVGSWELLCKISPTMSMFPLALEFSPDSKGLAFTVADRYYQSIQIWDLMPLARAGSLDVNQSDWPMYRSLAFHPSGKWLLCTQSNSSHGNRDGILQVQLDGLKVRSVQPVPQRFSAQQPMAMYFRDDEILVVDGDHLDIYSATTLQKLKAFCRLAEPIYDFDCSPSGIVTMTTKSGTLLVCSSEGEISGRLELGPDVFPPNFVRLSPDASCVAVITADAIHTIALRDGSLQFGSETELLPLRLDCSGLDLAGAIGLAKDQARFFYERGACLDATQMASLEQ